MTTSPEITRIIAAIAQYHGGYFTDEGSGSGTVSNLPKFTEPVSGGA